MNILFVSNYNVCEPVAGGIVRVTGALGRIFASRGHNCSIAYYENPSSGTPSGNFGYSRQIHRAREKEELSEIIRERAIDRIILQVPLNNSTKRLFRTVGTLKRDRPGLVTLHCIHQVPFAEMRGFDLHYLFFLMRHKSDKNLKEIIWGLTVILFPGFAAERTARRYRFVSENIDRTVLLSERYMKEYDSLVHCPEGTLFGINNPSDETSAAGEASDADKEKTVLFVGRLHEPTKRLSILLRVWGKLCRRYPDWRLVLVGDGIDRIYYEKLVKSKKIRNVSFEGIQSPEKYYSKASVFVNTSPCEGFPMTYLEAMQYGAVPLSFDGFGAVYDIIDDGLNGIIVPYKDVKAYRRNLEKLMTDEDMRRKMGENCRKKALCFSPDCIYSLWEKALA